MRHWEGDITPEYAQKLLDANERNRKLPVPNLRRYTRAMKEGNWHFIGDSIRVGKSGNLLDGQTRLKAIVASNTTQYSSIYYDVPDELQTFMDTGRSRSPADVFHMYGIPRATTAASITRMIILYKRQQVLDNSTQLDNDELLLFFEANRERIMEATREGHTLRTGLTGLNPTVSGVVYFLAREVADIFDVNFFFHRLIDGNFMTPGNPIGVFRNYVLRRQREPDLRTNRTEYLWHMITAWNHWANGESVTKTQLPKGGLYDSDQFPVTLNPVLPGVIPEAARNEYHQPGSDNLVVTAGGDDGKA